MRSAKGVQNSTECAVACAVEEIRRQSAQSTGSCWCSACEADVIALALAALPPDYRTAADPAKRGGKAGGDEILATVRGAVDLVAQRPREHCFDEDQGGQRLVNITYAEASMILETLVGESALHCECDACRHTILAYSLNRLAPKYGVLRKGATRFPRSEREDLRHEVALMVAVASGVVAETPPPQCSCSFC
jgi:hypothetical protein